MSVLEMPVLVLVHAYLNFVTIYLYFNLVSLHYTDALLYGWSGVVKYEMQ